jgi:hypothetical protein
LSQQRAKDKKWITTGLKISIRHKNRLYKKYITNPTDSNKLKYIVYKNKLTSCIRTAEADFYIKKITSEKANLTNLWKIFGGIINPSKVKFRKSITELISHGKKKKKR